MKKNRLNLSVIWATAILLVLTAHVWAGSAPDLTVRSVRLIQNAYQGKCRPVIDAENRGGAVSQIQFDNASVVLLKGSPQGQTTVWGAYGLRTVDPARHLAAPTPPTPYRGTPSFWSRESNISVPRSMHTTGWRNPTRTTTSSAR